MRKVVIAVCLAVGIAGCSGTSNGPSAAASLPPGAAPVATPGGAVAPAPGGVGTPKPLTSAARKEHTEKFVAAVRKIGAVGKIPANATEQQLVAVASPACTAPTLERARQLVAQKAGATPGPQVDDVIRAATTDLCPTLGK